MKLLRHGAAGAKQLGALDAHGRMHDIDVPERDWQTKCDGVGQQDQQTGGARLLITRRHGS